MRRFRTFIITKQHIYRAAIALTAAAAFTACAVIAFPDKGDTEPEAVTAYSPAEEGTSYEDDSYKDIIEQGLPNEDDGGSLLGTIKKLVGLDADKPETIINSASETIKDAAEQGSGGTDQPSSEAAPSQPATEPPPTEAPVQVRAELPSHEEITSSVGLEINNATNYNVDLDAMCAAELATKLTHEGPEVLIVHTHTTECFDGDAMSGESERTTNPDLNMCAVGDVIAETLEAHGIETVHDTSIHDYPTYQSAYTRTLETINKNMEQYPSIKVVLDVHRDAYIYNDGSKLRVAAEINGAETAQVMLVIGTDSMGLYHPHWRDNLTLAAKIQNAAEIMYPGLMRPINLRRERFNMHVTRGSLLLEIGSNGNSLAEAKTAGAYIADAIAAALLNG